MTSVLSMESPPFRPRGGGPGTVSSTGSFPSPGGGRRSGGSSPLSHGSGSGSDGYSNAVKSYSFQTPSGWVWLWFVWWVGSVGVLVVVLMCTITCSHTTCIFIIGHRDARIISGNECNTVLMCWRCLLLLNVLKFLTFVFLSWKFQSRYGNIKHKTNIQCNQQ